MANIQTIMLIFQLKANFDKKILFGKISHHLDTEIGKMLVNGMFGNENSIFLSDP